MNLQDPLVSILLPTHNRADVLPFAIQSVLAQTVQDFELLIVGDGCTDHTAEVVKSFSDSRIQWFDLPKAHGFGYANRNHALKTARGSFVAFMAHDDLWLSDHLAILLDAFDDEAIELVYSRPLWVIPQGMIVPGTFNLNFPATLQRYLNKEEARIPASCVVHRRECFAKYGYWDDSLPMSADWDLWVRFIMGGERKNFAYAERPTSLHFKANWQTEKYDYDFGFSFWKKLFLEEGFMPAQLKIPVPNAVTEQEAVWMDMVGGFAEWNKKIRSAIYLVLDALVNKGFIDWNNLNHEFQGFRQENGLLQEGLQAFRNESERLQNELVLARNESEGFQNELTFARNESEGFQDELTFARNESGRLQNALQVVQNENSKLEKESQVFKNELHGIKSTLTWRLREKIAGNLFLQRLYIKIKKRLF